jgi:hypothetical protein
MRFSSQNTDRQQAGSPSISHPPEAIAASDGATSAPEPLGTVLRFMIALSGIALLVCGAVAAFMVVDGVATAALVTAGFALLFLSYVGRYITRIRFRDFEADLEHFREKTVASLQAVEDKAAEVASNLQEVGRSYEDIRATMAAGGMRDVQMERQVADAMRLAIARRMSPDEVKTLFHSNDTGDRILALAAMKADPDVRDFQIILEAIEQPRSPFEQDRFLLLASEHLGNLDAEERRQLREAVEQQIEGKRIRSGKARWFTSQRLFELLRRIEEDSQRPQGGTDA